jgi:peptide deformylase
VIRPILRMGDPRLLQVAEPVRDFGTSELRSLLDDLFETMTAADGAGLAAPQIGVLLRVVVFGFERNARYPDALAVPQTILINPVIEPIEPQTEEGWEGCLSVPGMRGLVPRYHRVRYRGLDENGHPLLREVDGFHARVVQHECDHLDGILYPMRIRNLRDFGYADALFPGQVLADE